MECQASTTMYLFVSVLLKALAAPERGWTSGCGSDGVWKRLNCTSRCNVFR